MASRAPRTRSIAGPVLPRGREVEVLMACARRALAASAPRDARRLVDYALMLQPSDVAALCLSGEVHERLDRFDLAGVAYAEAMRLDPDDPAHAVRLARTQVVCAEDAEARALLAWVVATFPAHGAATEEALDLLGRLGGERA
jgi:cytochrome c-type biogenesis protein CcmH/NrfG